MVVDVIDVGAAPPRTHSSSTATFGFGLTTAPARRVVPLVTVSFCGLDAGGKRIALDIEDPAHLNMANANARAFLEFLGIEAGDGPSGEVPIAKARRAVVRARATFDRRAPSFTRSPTDTKRPGRARLVVSGMDEDYLSRRLDDFELFLAVVAARGAVSIYWG